MLFTSFLLIFSWFLPAPEPARVDPCSVYGAVYIEKNRSYADFSIYIEPEDGMAQLTVFKEDNKLFADKPGLWYLVDNPGFANYRVHITPDRGMADFSINYTESRSFAGCRR